MRNVARDFLRSNFAGFANDGLHARAWDGVVGEIHDRKVRRISDGGENALGSADVDDILDVAELVEREGVELNAFGKLARLGGDVHRNRARDRRVRYRARTDARENDTVAEARGGANHDLGRVFHRVAQTVESGEDAINALRAQIAQNARTFI